MNLFVAGIAGPPCPVRACLRSARPNIEVAPSTSWARIDLVIEAPLLGGKSRQLGEECQQLKEGCTGGAVRGRQRLQEGLDRQKGGK